MNIYIYIFIFILIKIYSGHNENYFADFSVKSPLWVRLTHSVLVVYAITFADLFVN